MPFAYCEWIWIRKQANAVLPDAMPNQCQANADQMPTRCQPDANRMPARCQGGCEAMPRKMPIRCHIGDMSHIHACPREYSAVGIPSPLSAHRSPHDALVSLSALYDAHRSRPLAASFPFAWAILPCLFLFLFGPPGTFLPFLGVAFLPFLGLAFAPPWVAPIPQDSSTSGWGGLPPPP